MKIYSITKEIKGCGVTAGHPTIVVKFADFANNTKDITSDELIKEIKKHDCRRVEITGTEPLLHQLELVRVLKQLHDDKYFVEVTTNGAIMPDLHIRDAVHLWNVCPKLPEYNKGLESLEIYLDSMMHFANNVRAGFTFMYTCKKDLVKIKECVSEYQIPHERVTIMPLANDFLELVLGVQQLRLFCIKHGFVLGYDLRILLFHRKAIQCG